MAAAATAAVVVATAANIQATEDVKKENVQEKKVTIVAHPCLLAYTTTIHIATAMTVALVFISLPIDCYTQSARPFILHRGIIT